MIRLCQCSVKLAFGLPFTISIFIIVTRPFPSSVTDLLWLYVSLASFVVCGPGGKCSSV